jgi:amino acid adenylation domain-containing protein
MTATDRTPMQQTPTERNHTDVLEAETPREAPDGNGLTPPETPLSATRDLRVPTGDLLKVTSPDWTDLAVAAAAAYQHRMTAARDIALAVDTVPVRLTVEPSTTVSELVAEVRRSRSRATRDEEPQPARAPHITCLDAAAPVDGLALTFDHRDGALRAEATGEPGRFTAGQLAAHTERIGHFTRRLFAAGAAAQVGEADLLTPAEYHRIMHEWNATAHEVPRLTLPELVEANVAAHPDRPAVSHHDERLSYAELDARANRLARLLIGRGAGAGDIVAMVLPRSIDYVVTALAIVKTGAAYLPVDTSYPTRRILQVLSDAGAAHVVTVAALSDPLQVTGTAPVVLDAEDTRTLLADTDPSSPTDADRRAPLTPDTPAYVLYTSGSTGRPKGVVVAHRAITNRLHHMQHQIPLGPDDRLLQKTPAGFDVTVREVFWPLLAGASIVVADPDGHRDPAYLVETIVAENITIAHFVPSGLKVFLQEPDAGKCVSLRRVVCGGEALPAELQAWFASVLEADLFNVYGPTEAAVDVSSMLCPKNPEPGPVLIGRPVWNTRLYILDEQRRMLPSGVIGELYIAGVQLAEGYLGQPELTADRFVDDPFGEPGARMYRSGDAARWRADGVIEFFGRLDHQVKIRGFRVELGEIESVLLRDGRLSQAVCLVREDTLGDQRLVAYVVPVAGTTPDVGTLRAQAEAALPDYMVPGAFVVLDELPLTPNEKLDRKALPKPPAPVMRAGREPSTPEERLVAELFGQILGLGVSSVDVEQAFFELGGDSLLASRLINEIHRRTGVRLRLKTILEDSRVRTIAALITA